MENQIHEHRSCTTCKARYPIYTADLPAYDKHGAPLPVECFGCRLQRRLASYNRRKLYRRRCDDTGRDIVSWLSPDKPFRVFHRDAWYSDRWDPYSYGRDIDFSRPFFEQFYELMLEVPMVALATYGEMENSEYTNDSAFAKNCYLSFDFGKCQDLLYTESASMTSDAVDSQFVFRSELLYECVGCTECYNLKYSRFCTGCSDSWFLRDCVGCKNCFGCVNVRNKEYWIFNQAATKAQYQAFLAAFHSGDAAALGAMQHKVARFFTASPARAPYQVQTENCVGEWLLRSKNLFQCFSCDQAEDCRYCSDIPLGAKDCLDLHCWGDNVELIFNSMVVGEGAQRVRCGLFVGFGASDIDYSVFCTSNVRDLFGCIGLRNASHAILNKRYSGAEYRALRERLIRHMQETGEWGQFFPAQYSYFGYNESVAQTYMPLSRTEVQARGWKWSDYDAPPTGTQTVKASELPSDIAQVPDSIVSSVILCEKSGRPFKITTKELTFYRQHELPLPRLHPDERHSARVQLRRGFALREAQCSECKTMITTNYPVGSTQRLVCEQCYESHIL